MAAEQGATNGTATSLRGGYLPFTTVLAQSVATVGPSPAAAIAPALIFATAGNGTWLSIVIAGVGSILVALAIITFAQRVASSGSLYTYAATSLGPFGGLITGWALLLAYGIGAPAAVVIIEIYADRVVDMPETGLVHGTIYLVVLVAAFLLAYRDVKLSAGISLVTESISIFFVVLLGVITLVHHGFRLDLAQLGLKGVSSTGVREGLVLAGGMFAGFEGCAVLGSEAKNPHRSIPLAIFLSVAIVGVLFTFMAYAQVLGFQNSGHSLAQTEAPLNTLAVLDGVPWLGRFIDLGLTIGIFAGVIGMLNAASRVIFTMARDGILPARLGHVQPRFRTPSAALALVAVPTWTIPLAFVLARTPVESVLGYLGTIDEFGFLVAYFIISLAAIAYLWQLDALRPHHVVISLLGAGMMAFIFGGQLFPMPAWPYNIFPYLTAAYFVAGTGFYGTLKLRAPHRVARVGATAHPAPLPASAGADRLA